MKSRGVISVFLLMVLIGTYFWMDGSGSSGPLVPDPQFDPSLGVDIPTWRTGDYWNYSTTFTVTYLGFPIPVSGWMNMSTAFVTLDLTISDSPVYITDIRGNLTGRLVIPPLSIDETIYVNLTGYMWERMQDLSMYRMILNASVSGTMAALNGNYPFGYEYFPPMEQYDFPLIPGEEWDVNVSARAPFGSSGDLLNVRQNMSCGDPITRIVPAGPFLTYPVSDDSGPILYYNQTVGNTVERVFDMDIQGVSLNIPWKLKEYEHQKDEARIRIWVSDKEPVMIGENFNVSGELSVGNTVVTLMFPGGKPAATIPMVGPKLTFTRTLKAPLYMDDTPTDFDHGSFGILAIVGSMEEYDVCTVTTKAVDLMANESSLIITYTNDGTKDDDFSAKVRIFNILNYGVGNFSFQLRDEEGGEVHSEVVNGLEAKETFTTTIDLGKFTSGDHQLELVVDKLDEVDEYDETNNAFLVNFTVLERPPLLVSSTVPPGNITANEGDWVNITATVSRGGEAVPTWNWTIDGEAVDWDGDLNISLGFIGELSSREEPYRIVHTPNPSYLFEDENGTMVWNLTVANVNRMPELLQLSPLNETVIVPEPETVLFSIEVSDPDLTTPTVEWKVDGVVVPANTNESLSYLFTSQYLGPNSSEFSPYLIEVMVFDSEDPSMNISHNWTLEVIDTDREPVINVTPEPGYYEVLTNGSMEFSVFVEDPDNDEVSVSWKIWGAEISEELSMVFSPLELNITRDETVNLALEVSVGIFETNYNWTVKVLLPPEPEEPEPVPPSGVTITSPFPGQEFETTDTIHFRVEHIDARPLVFTWYINGTFHTGQEVDISGLAPGNYVAVLNVSTEGPPPGWKELTVEFSIKAPSGSVDDDDDETHNEAFPWWILAVFVIGMAGIAVMIYLLLARGKKDVWSEE